MQTESKLHTFIVVYIRLTLSKKRFLNTTSSSNNSIINVVSVNKNGKIMTLGIQFWVAADVAKWFFQSFWFKLSLFVIFKLSDN